jgi:hypothetical protein
MTGDQFPAGTLMGIFIFTTASIAALGSTQPPIQWVLGAVTPLIKRPGLEDDHSFPSSAEVNDRWSDTTTPPIYLHGFVLKRYIFMALYLVKHRDSFTFTFIYVYFFER